MEVNVEDMSFAFFMIWTFTLNEHSDGGMVHLHLVLFLKPNRVHTFSSEEIPWFFQYFCIFPLFSAGVKTQIYCFIAWNYQIKLKLYLHCWNIDILRNIYWWLALASAVAFTGMDRNYETTIFVLTQNSLNPSWFSSKIWKFPNISMTGKTSLISPVIQFYQRKWKLCLKKYTWKKNMSTQPCRRDDFLFRELTT